MYRSWTQDGARNPWSAPTTELWAPTPSISSSTRPPTCAASSCSTSSMSSHARPSPSTPLAASTPTASSPPSSASSPSAEPQRICAWTTVQSRLGRAAGLVPQLGHPHRPHRARIPASSGMTNRHRLNRRGDRHLNCAIHIVALQRQQRDADPRPRPTVRSADASSATSHESSTASSNQDLTNNRSVLSRVGACAIPGEAHSRPAVIAWQRSSQWCSSCAPWRRRRTAFRCRGPTNPLRPGTTSPVITCVLAVALAPA